MHPRRLSRRLEDAFMRLIVPLAAATVLATTLLATTAGGAFAASAVQKECSAKYQAAKSGGTLNGMTYNQFYSQCAKEEKAGGTATPTTTAAPATAPAAPASRAAAPMPTPAAPTTAAAGGAAVFPTAVSAEFSKESAGKARMHTCLAQYKANGSSKGAANAGLKWIEKGGGYYSECNKRLKG